jgi:1-acyl-sn-glycerol-3-phosphate acyltransferase
MTSSTPRMRAFYWAWRALGRAFFASVFRVRVEGLEHIPRRGGYIVSLNHTSLFDPPLVGTIVPVEMRFMAKRQLFTFFPPFGSLLKGVGAIPIERGEADRRAVRLCVDALREGYPLSVFPEGTRNLAARGQPRGGAAFLALHARVPVLPGAILGPYRVGHPLWVRFGPVIDWQSLAEDSGGVDGADSGHARLDRLSRRIMTEIQRIHAELVADHGEVAHAPARDVKN